MTSVFKKPEWDKSSISAREYLKSVYLDYLNNYIGVSKFAEHNGLTFEQAYELINLARIVFNSEHPDK